MSGNDRHIARVIELGKFRNTDPITPQKRRRIRFSPRQALYYNDHPDAIIEDFERNEYGRVLPRRERAQGPRTLLSRLLLDPQDQETSSVSGSASGE
jgi:hypothetical protein